MNAKDMLQAHETAIDLLKAIAGRLNIEESEKPGGRYILAGMREGINEFLRGQGVEPPGSGPMKREKWGIWAVRHEGSIFGYGATWHTKGLEREEFDTEGEAKAKATKMNEATGSALVSYRSMPIE